MYSQVTCIALSRSRDAVPGTTRLPMALPILPDVIGLPPIAEFIRENGLLPMTKNSWNMLNVIKWLNYCGRSYPSNFVNCMYWSYPQVQLFLFEIGYVCIPFWVYCLVHPHLWKYEYINLYRQKSKRCPMKIKMREEYVVISFM